MKFGRGSIGLFPGEGPHQFVAVPEVKPALPSTVPVPLIATFLRLEPMMNVVVPGQFVYGSIFSVAPASIIRLTLFFSVIGPLKYVLSVPLAGIRTIAPRRPLTLLTVAELMAALMAAALLDTPLPSAPPAKIVLVTSRMMLVLMTGNGGVPARADAVRHSNVNPSVTLRLPPHVSRMITHPSCCLPSRHQTHAVVAGRDIGRAAVIGVVRGQAKGDAWVDVAVPN